MAPTSILFVDDDPRVLAGLRRLLRTERRQWAMTFADSGASALALLDQQAFDVVVTDMRMPGMDGATLLHHVRRRRPATVRIVLSGHTEVTAAMKAVPVAHRFLSKPCEPEALRAAVRQASSLQARLHAQSLRDVAGSLATLPSPPQVLAELNALLERGDASIAEVAAVVERDAALSAKLLQLVNSAFFGLGRRVSRIHDAVSYLGIGTVRNLSTALLAVTLNGRWAPPVAAAVLELRSRSLEVASLARELLVGSDQGHDAFAAGLLHDIGHLVIASSMGDRFQVVLERTRAGEPLAEVELDVLGASHSDLGGYLLSLWGLPYEIVDAVVHHHDATERAGSSFDVVHSTYIAASLVAQHRPSMLLPDPTPVPLDPAYLDRLGVADRVAELSAELSA